MKEKESGFRARSGDRGGCRLSNGRNRDVKPLRDEHGILVIQVGAATKLCDDEVNGSQHPDAKVVTPDQIGCAVFVPRRHRYHRPAAYVLCEIRGNMSGTQECQKRVKLYGNLGINILRVTIMIPIGLQRQGADQ